MEYRETCSHALLITFRQPVLWVLALPFALASGFVTNLQLVRALYAQLFVPSPGLGTFLQAFSERSSTAESCLSLLWSGVILLAGVAVEAALIAMVAEAERTGKTALGTGTRAAGQHFAVLLGINLLFSVPLFLVDLLIFGPLLLLTRLMPRSAAIYVVWPIAFLIVAVVSALARLVLTFAARSRVLAGLGFGDSLAHGTRLLRRHLRPAIGLVLLLFAVEAVVTGPFVLSAAGLGLYASYTGRPLVSYPPPAGLLWLLAVAVPAAVIVMVLWSALWELFTSAVWTLTYRRLAGDEELSEVPASSAGGLAPAAPQS